MKKETLVYHNGGDVCLQEQTLSPRLLKWKAAYAGHVGYLIGHRYWDGIKQRVMVFFKERPTQEEILRRRGNGFLAARWFYLK
jgi:hypothetical protein